MPGSEFVSAVRAVDWPALRSTVGPLNAATPWRAVLIEMLAFLSLGDDEPFAPACTARAVRDAIRSSTGQLLDLGLGRRLRRCPWRDPRRPEGPRCEAVRARKARMDRGRSTSSRGPPCHLATESCGSATWHRPAFDADPACTPVNGAQYQSKFRPAPGHRPRSNKNAQVGARCHSSRVRLGRGDHLQLQGRASMTGKHRDRLLTRMTAAPGPSPTVTAPSTRLSTSGHLGGDQRRRRVRAAGEHGRDRRSDRARRDVPAGGP